MAYARVQLRRTIVGAPTLGRWDTYTGAHFETSTAVPTTTVQTLLVRLLCGAHASDNGGNRWCSNSFLDTGPGRAQLSTWTWAGHWAPAYSEPLTLPVFSVAAVANSPLALQQNVCIGYRADLGTGVPRQRGRTRFRVGPLNVKNSAITVDVTNGGLRLSEAGVIQATANAVSCINALAAEGWSLVVKVGAGPYTFHPATEVYVDDVIDVSRSRRPWQAFQERTAL